MNSPDALYHITSRGDRREDIYDDDAHREAFLKIFSKIIEQKKWYCYSYCLMSNHYHLLIQTPDANLSKGMRQLNGIYTQYYNRRHGFGTSVSIPLKDSSFFTAGCMLSTRYWLDPRRQNICRATFGLGATRLAQHYLRRAGFWEF